MASVGGNLLSAFAPVLSRRSLGRLVLSSRDFTTEEDNNYTPQKEVTDGSAVFPSLDARYTVKAVILTPLQDVGLCRTCQPQKLLHPLVLSRQCSPLLLFLDLLLILLTLLLQSNESVEPI